MLEDAVGEHLTGDAVNQTEIASRSELLLYRYAMQRGNLDAVLNDWIVRPFIKSFEVFDSLERRWTDLLSGENSRESDRLSPYSDSLEDVA